MADDRIWLYCDKCSEKILLWKHYALGGFIPNSFNEQILALFFAKHLECNEKLYTSSLGDDCGIAIKTEAAVMDHKKCNV